MMRAIVARVAGGSRMKFMCLLYGESAAGPAPGSPEFGRMLADYGAATEAMAKAGVLLDSAPLQPVTSATTIRVRDGETLLTDGPFAEIKEQLGGYYLLECEDLDSALKWAATIPAVSFGSVEVRPLMSMEMPQ
jgi:hypothetical protein